MASYQTVCRNCLPPDSRKEFENEVDLHAHCDFCRSGTPGVPLPRVASRLGTAIRQLYQKGGLADPVGQLGDRLEDLISGLLLDANHGLVQALANSLVDLDAGAENPFFTAGECYTFRDEADEPVHQRNLWEGYADRVQFRARFFDEEIRRLLTLLVLWMDKVAGPGTPHHRMIQPGTKIWRARSLNYKEDVAKVLKDPIRELRPPPDRLRRAGRLNAAGIPVFYGAFSLDTVSAELRPAVGSFIVSGEFEVLRNLRVLDLSAFVQPVQHVSILSPDYMEHRKWGRFFAELQHVISRPTLDHDTVIDYLPTQILAEYLADVANFDGLVFRSAQIGLPENPDQKNNIALFHGDIVVEPPDDDIETKAILEKIGASPAVRYVDGSAKPMYVKGVRVTTGVLHDLDGELATAEEIIPELFR